MDNVYKISFKTGIVYQTTYKGEWSTNNIKGEKGLPDHMYRGKMSSNLYKRPLKGNDVSNEIFKVTYLKDKYKIFYIFI